MILEDISVEGFGALRNKVSVTGLSDGINIIYGPNEIGKSTLMNALVTGVFEKYNTNAKAIKSLVPWGTTVNPKIELVFRANGRRYKFAKQFLQNAAARLFEETSGMFQLLAEGDSADKLVRGLVGADEGDPKDRGLTELLWVPQGYTAIDPLPQHATSGLESLLGGQVTNPIDRDIISSVRTDYDRFYGKRGLLPTSTVQKLAKELERLTGELEQANTELANIEQLSSEVSEVEAKLSDYRERLALSLEEQRRAGAELQALQARLHQAQIAELELRTALKEAKLANERHTSIVQLRGKIAQFQQKAITAKGELELLKTTMGVTQKSIDSLQSRINEMEEKVAAQNTLLQLVAKKKRVEDIQSIISRWDDESKAQTQLYNQLSQLNAPTAEEWSKIIDMKRQFDALTVALSTVTSSLTFESLREDLHLELYPTGTQDTLHHHERRTWDVGNAFSLTIQGIGKLTLTSADRSNILDEFESLKRDLAGAIALYGRTFEQLSLDVETANELRNNIELSKRTQKGIAKNGLDDLNDELHSILRGVPTDLQDIFERLDPSGAKQLETELAELTDLLKSLKATKAEREESAKAERDQERDLTKQIAEYETSMSTHKDQLSDLVAGETDEERLKLLQDHEKKVIAETEKYEALKVPAEEKKRIEDRATEADNTVENLKQMEYTTNITLSKLQSRLEEYSTQGWYSKKISIEEELAVQLALYEEEKLYAEGLKFLLESLQTEMDQTVQSFIGPVTARIGAKLQDVSNSRYDLLEFADGFAPTSIRLNGRTETVSIHTLSGGAREQLSLLVRLTLGEIASKQQKQLVVLDDPLINTDDLRLLKTLQWLVEASSVMQIVVLTCHPQRYEKIAATFHDMEFLKSSAS